MLVAALAAATVFGHSVEGAPIAATAHGSGETRVLVIGSIHGNERAGEAVVERLRRVGGPHGVKLHLVRSVNPDSRLRWNSRGVDLNRNFPRGWRRGGGTIYNSGPSPASEPETRAVMRMVRRIRPHVTIWFHQHMDCVNPSSGADLEFVRSYARLTRQRLCRLPRYPGTATRWQNASFPGTSAFVVELPAGRLTPRQVRRHARAAKHMGERAAAARVRGRQPRPGTATPDS